MAPYRISYSVGYEPYLLISRRLMPLYDERFRGYGFDKASNLFLERPSTDICRTRELYSSK